MHTFGQSCALTGFLVSQPVLGSPVFSEPLCALDVDSPRCGTVVQETPTQTAPCLLRHGHVRHMFPPAAKAVRGRMTTVCISPGLHSGRWMAPGIGGYPTRRLHCRPARDPKVWGRAMSSLAHLVPPVARMSISSLIMSERTKVCVTVACG